MVRFINHVSGGVMYVHESRVEEYLAYGDRPAEEPSSAAPEPVPAEKPAAAPRKKKKAKDEW